jgi:hypothetical protein
MSIWYLFNSRAIPWIKNSGSVVPIYAFESSIKLIFEEF